MSRHPTHYLKNSDMRPNLLMTIILPLLLSGNSRNENIQSPYLLLTNSITTIPVSKKTQTIKNIPLPGGYQRIEYGTTSFPAWLRTINIKKDKRVFLYNGELKRNQSAQFAVLDIPVGKKDLQQCADAVMRLRAQYLFDHSRFDEIRFSDNNGKQYKYGSSYRLRFEDYLEKVFSYCGTISLEKQLKRVNDFNTMQSGDVLIKGGSPGHAVLIMDIAINGQGNKIYLLAQSYMPAQDIHILNNPMDNGLSPWYNLKDKSLICTPEWIFETWQLRRW